MKATPCFGRLGITDLETQEHISEHRSTSQNTGAHLRTQEHISEHRSTSQNTVILDRTGSRRDSMT